MTGIERLREDERQGGEREKQLERVREKERGVGVRERQREG